MLPVKLGILPKRSNGLGGEVKGRWSGKQYCRQGKAVEIPVWVCLTAPTGGVASGFLRHWTGPASSTQEFQGFNIYLKTISSDMVHGLARVRTVTNMGSISFLLLLLLVLITTGFYILTLQEGRTAAAADLKVAATFLSLVMVARRGESWRRKRRYDPMWLC